MPVHKSIELFDLKKAINSCLKNSILPSQFLIIINGNLSSQNKLYLYQLKKKFKFIHIFYCKKLGIQNALNYGLKKSKNDIIFRADADDFNLRNRFEKQLNFFIKNDLDILGCQNIEIYNKNFLYKKKINKNPNIIDFIFRNPLNHMSVVFSKKKILFLGGYPDIPYKEDYALWFKAFLANYKIKNMHEALVYSNVNNNFFKRRKNFKSFSSEIKLFKFIFKLHFMIGFLMIFISLIRSLILLLPNNIFEKLYKTILRKKLI